MFLSCNIIWSYSVMSSTSNALCILFRLILATVQLVWSTYKISLCIFIFQTLNHCLNYIDHIFLISHRGFWAWNLFRHIIFTSFLMKKHPTKIPTYVWKPLIFKHKRDKNKSPWFMKARADFNYIFRKRSKNDAS